MNSTFLKNYNEFLIEYKIENEINLIFSDTFKRLLKRIDSENSKKLLNLENQKGKYPISYIDIDEENSKFITYLNNKDIDNVDDLWNNNKRQKAKIGKVIKILLKDINPSDNEKFVNKIKSEYKEFKENINERFKIVDGEDLVYWYNEENYKEIKGTLGNSCMRNAEYLDMYEKNPETVKLLILKSKEEKDKIIGRALLWYIDTILIDKIFMDRIYTINDEDVELFINYAKRNKFIYKTKQGFEAGKLIDSSTNEEIKSIKVKLENIDFNEYPYLDTLYYYNSEKGILSNDSSLDYDMTLLGTNGEPESIQQNEETLRNELEMESIDYLAETYGMRPIYVALNEEDFVNDFINIEVDNFIDSGEDFLSNYSYELKDIISSEDIYDEVYVLFDKFFSEFQNDIESFLEEELDDKKTKNIEFTSNYLKEYFKKNMDIFKRMVDYVYNNFTSSYNLWDSDFGKVLWEEIDRSEKIEYITKLLKDNFYLDNIIGIFGYDKYLYDDGLINILKNYINKEKLIDEIILLIRNS